MRGMTAAELIAELQHLEPHREVRLVLADDSEEPVTRENIQHSKGAVLFKPYFAPMQKPVVDGGSQGRREHKRCVFARECMHFEEDF